MKKAALQVEHRIKNRFVGSCLLSAESGLTTIGSAQTAKIRVLGEEIAGLHAALEFHEGEWHICDLGSKTGTWINKQSIIEEKISEPTTIQVGAHVLKVTPLEMERNLFEKNDEVKSAQGPVYHQVVVLKNGVLIESSLLPQTENFEFNGQVYPAPKDHDWVVTEAAPFVLKQRLVNAEVLPETRFKETIGEGWNRPAPLIALGLFVIVMLAFMLAPHKPDDELKTLKPTMQNQYTRMIFDGKKLREKKVAAEKMRKSLQGQTRQGVPKPTPGGDAGAKLAGGKGKPAPKVVTNIRAAGLGALIGKVAARASKNAQLVQAAGLAADNARSGRALALGGGSSLDKLGGGTSGGDTKKIGGLGTAGKGGGTTGYKGTGSLSLGNTGSAEVGILDEETEVAGGLDKEVIARVIKSQLGQIRYCYERQLSANPDLYGKILVKFTIGATGSVVAQSIGTTSLNNAMVEGCILRRIAGWKFPTPKGGTNVLVTYPFLFKSNR